MSVSNPPSAPAADLSAGGFFNADALITTLGYSLNEKGEVHYGNDVGVFLPRHPRVDLPDGVPALPLRDGQHVILCGESSGPYEHILGSLNGINGLNVRLLDKCAYRAIDWSRANLAVPLAPNRAELIDGYFTSVFDAHSYDEAESFRQNEIAEQKARAAEEARQREEAERERLLEERQKVWTDAGLIEDDGHPYLYTLTVGVPLAAFAADLIGAQPVRTEQGHAFFEVCSAEGHKKDAFFFMLRLADKTRIDISKALPSDYLTIDLRDCAIKVNEEYERQEVEEERAKKCFAGEQFDQDAKQQFLIEDLIGETGTTVLAGNQDSGKTFMAVDWAVHMAYGLPWMGRKVKQRPVIYYALEGSDGVRKRFAAAEKHVRYGEGGPFDGQPAPIQVLTAIPKLRMLERGEEQFDSVYLRPEFENEPSPFDAWLVELTHELLHMADHSGSLRPKPTSSTSPGDIYGGEVVVIIDTLRHAIGGGDKSPAAAEFILRCINLVKFGEVAHVIIIHHNTKTGNDTAGSGDIITNTDHHFKVTKTGNRVRLTCDRVKDFAKPDPISFGLKEVEIGMQTTLVVEGPANLKADAVAVVSALGELPDTSAITEKALRDALNTVIDEDKTSGAQRKARSRLKKELLSDGVLVQADDGVYALKQ